MLTPVRLSVRGFRGFSKEQTFDLSAGVTILSGENHCGKSSTLNAVEWCLFGAACIGLDTAIRERIGWLVPNRHLPKIDVAVELHLADGDETFVVRRTLSQSAKKKGHSEHLEVESHDGEIAHDSAAEALLANWLKCSFRDFSTTVYQHQETIRGIVTQEPRDRNDAIDRLLGLSEHRNLLGGIATANLSGFQRSVIEKCDAFEGRVKTALALIKRHVEETEQSAASVGFTRAQLTLNIALQLAATCKQEVEAFALEIGLTVSQLTVPEDSTSLKSFERSFQAQVQKFRSELPDLREQNELYGKQRQINGAIQDHVGLKTTSNDIDVKLGKLANEYGDHEQIKVRLAEISTELERLKSKEKEISGKQQVLVEAVQLLRECATEDREVCPVCETTTPGLLGRLEQKMTTSLRGSLETVQRKTKELVTERITFDGVKSQYEELARKTQVHNSDKAQWLDRVATLLGHKPAPTDDPLAMLNVENARISRKLSGLALLIEERQNKLNALEQDGTKMRIVREAVERMAKQRIIEEIKRSHEYRELNEVRDVVARFVNYLEEVKSAINQASNVQANQKLELAQNAIDRYFRQVTRNPAITQVQIQVKADPKTSRNIYEVTDQVGSPLTPILSQGDLNALALAMFLGLVSAGVTRSQIALVMLDDPSQSMGPEHKDNLIAVLNEVCEKRRVIVASMDGEFVAGLDKGLTKAKTFYDFDGWTPSGGPEIRRK